jgi:hypothetical protein
VIVRALFPLILLVWSNELVPHLGGIFPFVELVSSIPSHNRTLELPPGVEQFHHILPNSRTEHTLNLFFASQEVSSNMVTPYNPWPSSFGGFSEKLSSPIFKRSRSRSSGRIAY